MRVKSSKVSISLLICVPLSRIIEPSVLRVASSGLGWSVRQSPDVIIVFRGFLGAAWKAGARFSFIIFHSS